MHFALSVHSLIPFKVENVLLLEPSPTSAVKIADFGEGSDNLYYDLS